MDSERKQWVAAPQPPALDQQLSATRAQSLHLIAGLSDADATVQSMDDASPAKWHLAHTTWFFEEFVLGTFAPGYQVHDERFRYLFNSYYEAVGPRHPRPRRGMLTRPNLAEVIGYREHVDAAMARLLEGELPAEALQLIELGVHHEQQHQELLLTDLLHLFAQNPLKPAYRQAQSVPALSAVRKHGWVESAGGIVEVGHPGGSFNFDCETPRHRALLQPHALSTHLVTNREWLAFMEDGGYRDPRLWLSDGWRTVQTEQWSAPMYWEEHDGAWTHMTLNGEQPLVMEAPVCHVSFFEADAYARWAGKRLPTEFEWEAAAERQKVAGNFADSQKYRPMPVDEKAAAEEGQGPLKQLYGDVWEWTSSPYIAYPGFRTAPGAVGEYNGKFMNGQFVLRGGSCATPAGHARASYRNFFYPHQRWQFMGLRLAEERG